MRSIATTSLIALGLALSGCATPGAVSNQSLDSVHQPVVQRVDYVLDVNTSGDGLAAGEVPRIRGWLDSLRLAYGDRVSVDSGESGAAHAAINSVAALVGYYGLTLSAHPPVTQGAIVPGAVRVIVSRTMATVPSCATQGENGLVNYQAAVTPGYGCAVNATLAAMMANPEDLIQGRTATDGNGRTASTNAVTSSAINGYYNATGTHAGQTK